MIIKEADRYGALWVHSGFSKRPKSGKAISCHAGTADYKRKNISGQNIRTGLLKAAICEIIKEIEKSDVIIIKSIDRLGRNYGEILEQWRKITKEIGADIQVIDMPLLNTNSFHEDLTGVFISDLVLQTISYLLLFAKILSASTMLLRYINESRVPLILIEGEIL